MRICILAVLKKISALLIDCLVLGVWCVKTVHYPMTIIVTSVPVYSALSNCTTFDLKCHLRHETLYDGDN